MRIDLSKDLAKPLAKHLNPAKEIQPDLWWRAEVAQIGTHICVVAEEQYSHYILVLCGLGKDDFANFPQLFCDRLWREVAVICKLSGLYDRETLAKHLLAICGEQRYHLDPEPQEEGRLLSVMEKLERRFLYERQPLPTDGKSAFEFGFEINSRKPKTDRENDKPSAAEALGNYCLNLIEEQLAAEQELIRASVPGPDNIVRVDFLRQRRL